VSDEESAGERGTGGGWKARQSRETDKGDAAGKMTDEIDLQFIVRAIRMSVFNELSNLTLETILPGSGASNVAISAGSGSGCYLFHCIAG